MRALACAAALVAGACHHLTTVELGESDGVLPLWYEEQLFGLPSSFAPHEWPDGTWELHLSAWQVVTLTIRTRADGGRDVTYGREAWMLDAASAAWYRDALGEARVRSLRGVDLELLELEVDDVDLARTGAPTFAVGGRPLEHGARTAVDRELLERLRATLLAGEDIYVPISLTFHLPADALDALPGRLRLFVLVQPTLHVDVLAL